MPSCNDLLESHADLASRLQNHLEAVVVGDLDAARHTFLRFAALLFAHSGSEDEVLIPAFQQAGLESKGCSVAILHKEHAKLRRLVTAAQERVFEDDAILDAPTRILWVESMHMLKEVLEHHDMRERAAFNPVLDQALGGEKASALAAEARALEIKLEADWLSEHSA
ncbi:MAG: hypothetical protein COA70_09185 [Planctomycetota bacterium]|nr:MAG: hypothetical protein COA70_09185 [Planctomycetota bacterium]